MFDLEYILKLVANGSLSVKKARKLIEEEFHKIHIQHKNFGPKVIDEMMKKSSDIVGQISSNMPHLEKFGEMISEGVVKISAKDQITGFETKMTLVTNAVVSKDCIVNQNTCVGCQIVDWNIKDTSTLNACRFLASSIQKLSFVESAWVSVNISFSKINTLTIQDSDFKHCQMTRNQLSDFSITDCKWEHLVFTKLLVKASVFNKCVFNKVAFKNSEITECDFDSCHFNNIEFTDCHFEDCSFADINLRADSLLVIKGKSFTKLDLSDCDDLDKFLAQAQ